MGAGLLGAILSPFAAALRLGNSMIVGLKNTVTMFQKGKIKTERFRFPRHITKNQPLNPYDENFAEIQAMIKILFISMIFDMKMKWNYIEKCILQ